MSASPEIKLLIFPAELLCAECREYRIPAPPGATVSTRFTCRDCTARLVQKANIESARRWREWLVAKDTMAFVL